VAGVTVDGLSDEVGPPISDDVRQRGVDVLQGLMASGRVDLDRFHEALDGLLGARTPAEFAVVVRSLPLAIEFTPPDRRRHEPFEISTAMGEVHLEGRWQVSRVNTISVGMGTVTIDLSDAEFDDWDVEIVVHAAMGAITLVVPRGFDVRQVGRSGAVVSSIEPPIPGFPVVRLSATSDMGAIRVVHPSEPKPRRRSWRRRRQRMIEP
jgi:DUF1707 SHOCT-like domain/Cell wall-active antibiotics response LiaF, C-terminal